MKVRSKYTLPGSDSLPVHDRFLSLSGNFRFFFRYEVGLGFVVYMTPGRFRDKGCDMRLFPG